MSSSLKSRTIKNVKWATLSKVICQVIQICSTVLIAHILAPSEFGIVGMATVVTGFIAIFKDLGTSAAIIQKQDVSVNFLSSVYWGNVSFGIIIFIIVFAASPLVATFYNEPRVANVLRALSVSFLIAAATILHKAILEKELAFNKLAINEITAVVASSAIAIVLVLNGAGVWCLVAQTLIADLVRSIMLIIQTSWRPRLYFNLQQIREISTYSLNLVAFNIFNYFSRNADYLLIGKCLGAKDLGYYTLAYKIMLYPLRNIAGILFTVMFPTLSKVQSNQDQFNRIYLKTIQNIAFFTFPLMIGLFGLSDLFIRTFFGEQWMKVASLLMILAPVGMFQTITSSIGLIYKAKARTDIMFYWSVGSGILVVAGFLVGINWGVLGVAFSYATSQIILTYPAFAIPFKIINLRVYEAFDSVKKSFVYSLIMLAAILLLKRIIWFDLPALAITLLVIVGAGIYMLCYWIFDREDLKERAEFLSFRKKEEST